MAKKEFELRIKLVAEILVPVMAKDIEEATVMGKAIAANQNGSVFELSQPGAGENFVEMELVGVSE